MSSLGVYRPVNVPDPQLAPMTTNLESDEPLSRPFQNGRGVLEQLEHQ